MTQDILPTAPEEALRKLIDITCAMKDIVKRESDALALSDGDALRTAIDQKADLAFMYEDAGREFQKRREEFRGVAPALLDELAAEQDILQTLERENRVFYDKAQSKVS